MSLLNETLTRVDKTEERYYEAELYRLKGELTLQQENQKAKGKGQKAKISNTQPLTPSSQDEACFLKAIEIAQKQQAKSLELRAAMSLVRLRQQQAAQSDSRTTEHASRTKLNEARTILTEVYHWFTEGFDTVDLKEAKALLEELS